MNILFAASELTPYAKTGGLGDVLAALPATLRTRGHSISCVLPLYRGILAQLPAAAPTGLQLSIPLGNQVIQAPVWHATTEEGVSLFLIQHDPFFDRSHLYGSNSGDYSDNASRFIFFSKVIVEVARFITPSPQIIHLSDWQTGLVPAFVRAQGLPFKTVFTIHNLAYQGSFWGLDFALTNLPGEYFTPPGVEFYGYLNCIKAGITLAHQVTTVSPRYAEEIQTEAFGCGLNQILSEHRHKLTGILNGVDYRLWNPQDDRFIPAPFHAGNLKGKAASKEALLHEFNLPEGEAPLFSCLTRLAHQKGVDLIRDAIEELLEEEIRFILIGSGDPEFETYFRQLALRYPKKVGVYIGFNEKRAHQVIAGSDFFLMPSRYEPCGLTQMYSLRYGTLPIVHETGGLADSVVDYDLESNASTGFVFRPYERDPFLNACRRALSLFKQKAELLKVRRQAIQQEFSWDHSAAGYEAVYRRAVES